MKKETCTRHIRHIRVQGDMNNKMERLNGEIRDREKVMRGLKKPETPIIPGYQIYHNYIRPHEALEGKTPAEACGIKGRRKRQVAHTDPKREKSKGLRIQQVFAGLWAPKDLLSERLLSSRL
jgi:hypothetical protein